MFVIRVLAYISLRRGSQWQFPILRLCVWGGSTEWRVKGLVPLFLFWGAEAPSFCFPFLCCVFIFFFFIKYNIIYNKKWKRNKEWLNEYGSTINVNCRAGGTDGENAAYKGRPNQKRACLAVDPTRAFRVDYVPVGVHVVFTWCLSAPLF